MKRETTQIALFMAVLAALAAAIWLMTKPSPSTTAPPTTTKTDIQLRLPNAAPLKAIAEDYAKPSSLWVVVSKSYPLSDTQYIPGNLVVPNVQVNEQKTTAEQSVRADIAQPLAELFAAAKKAGFDLMVASGYRSYELQQTYFASYASQYGQEAANTFSALPGQSEHQTGLSLDISTTDRVCYLDTCFGDTAAGMWLAAHAPSYGFILRYPADKTQVTQYQYEPWHFRYVGKSLASALTTSKLTLDEAYPYLQKTLAQLKKQGKT